jgi:hypothetical protein
MTPEVIETVLEKTNLNPFLSSEKLAQQMRREGNPIDRRTIDEVRFRLLFNFVRPRAQPFLKPIQKSKRVEFCQKALRNAMEGGPDWATDVVISDESRFGLFSDSRRRWVQLGANNPAAFVKRPKHDTTVMVWGAIGYGYKSELQFILKTMKAITYELMFRHFNILPKMIKNFTDRGRQPPYFQQDGAPPHKAKTSMDYLRSMINLIEDWPPNSPDLSPIETLWGILKRKMAEREPSNIKELKQFLKEEWEAIDQNTIDKLMAGINGRFRLCVRHNGETISHLLTHKRLQEADQEPTTILTPKQVGTLEIGKTIVLWGRVAGKTSWRSENGPEALITMCDPTHFAQLARGELGIIIGLHAPTEIGDQLEIGREYFVEAKVHPAKRPWIQTSRRIRGFQCCCEFIRFIETDRDNNIDEGVPYPPVRKEAEQDEDEEEEEEEDISEHGVEIEKYFDEI